MKSIYKKNKILITGCAGFIGFHTTIKLLNLGYCVVGVDSLNHYYDQSLKKNRLKEIFKTSKKTKGKFVFFKYDINDKIKILNIFKKNKFYQVIHLAAQAGVRNSIKHPFDYFSTNLFGFCNILENCKNYSVKHLIFASSSSVYGSTNKFPFSEHSSSSDQPIQLYAATKRSNEIIAYSYSHLYKMKITGLRFFTVYGPWGRPDMAIYKFTKNILENKKIKVFNYGEHFRDFTYISDIVKGILKAKNRKKKKLKKSEINFEIINIGNGKPIKLLKCIDILEETLKTKANKIFLKKQQGDMYKTYSNNLKVKKMLNFRPSVNLKSGIKKFVNWYLDYHGIKI